MKKRILSGLLMLCMVMTILPAQAIELTDGTTAECTCTVRCAAETPDSECAVCVADVSQCTVQEEKHAPEPEPAPESETEPEPEQEPEPAPELEPAQCTETEGCTAEEHLEGCPEACNCEVRCTEENVKEDCSVCSREGAVLDEICKGIAQVPDVPEVTETPETTTSSDEPAVVQPSEPITLNEPSTIYVSENGDDTSGNGTQEKPYASLAKAVAGYGTDGENENITINVMSDLTVDESTRFWDLNVTIQSYPEDEQFTITRGEDFALASDLQQGGYNGAMVEVNGSLTLKNVVFDDAMKYEGTIFSQTVPTDSEEYEDHPNEERVQHAVIGTWDPDAVITFGEGAIIKNYGGMSAVRMSGGTLYMEAGSKIYDVMDRTVQKGGGTGPAGAVWLQSGELVLEEGAEICNMVGRAVYADDGSVFLNGTISNITGDDNMWQGTGGIIVHVRNGAACTLQENCLITNHSADTVSTGTLFNIIQEGSSAEMESGARIQNWNGTGNVFYIEGPSESELCRLQINGIINHVNTSGNHIVQTVRAKVDIGEDAEITYNKVSYGTIYIQGGNTVEIRGKVNYNYSADRGGAVAITNHGDSDVIMYDGAEMIGNYSKETGGGLLVSDGTFTMNGGIISQNYAALEGGGVYVRQGGSFIMNGGSITENYSAKVGGGIAFASDVSSHSRVVLQSGLIDGNFMDADITVDPDAGICTAQGGKSNDLSIASSGGANTSTHMMISSEFTLGNSEIHMEKYEVSIQNPGPGVKFGNAAASCETAVTDKLNSQHLTEVVASLWYQTEHSAYLTAIHNLKSIDGYDPEKELYAAVIETDAAGNPAADAGVTLQAVEFDENDVCHLVLPGNTNGYAVVFVQEADQEAQVVKITPADITVYMGGDGGYEGVVGEDGMIPTNPSNSMPKPLFSVDVSGNANPVDVKNITLSGADGRQWKFKPAGNGLYYMESSGFDGQDPVRVTFTGIDGAYHINDTFVPSEIEELYATYAINIYRGSAGNVTASVSNDSYLVATGTGMLTVRAVADQDPTQPIVGQITTPVPENSAVAVAPAGTTYTLNNTGVPVTGGAPSLLFDHIIEDADSTARTDALKAKVDETLDAIDSNVTRHYEFRYLDLVDAQNGNAWIKASQPVNIYWGYPEGTNKNTTFKILHFPGLHRDGNNSGYEVEDIQNCSVDTGIQVVNTDYGIQFSVQPGGFSPFVLVWETVNDDDDDDDDDRPSRPSKPDKKPSLEKGDHYAYIVGYEDGTVRPNTNITRAEVATIFFRLLTDESREDFWSTTNGYRDTRADAWYNNAISTMTRAGVLTGYEDMTFRPYANITRAEFATIAARFLSDPYAGRDRFSDISGHWAAEYINRAAREGWINGYPDGTFRPDQPITRAEAMTLVNAVLERAPHEDYLLDDMIVWPDNPENTWYYEAVQEATNSHDYKWYEDEDYEEWTKLLENRDWVVLEQQWAEANDSTGADLLQ